MMEYMKKVAVVPSDLTMEEQNLLAVALKNVLGRGRASWRVISTIEQKEEDVNELTEMCTEILTAFEIQLKTYTTSTQSIEFVYKMKGDYYRYRPENVQETKRRGSPARSPTDQLQLPSPCRDQEAGRKEFAENIPSACETGSVDQQLPEACQDAFPNAPIPRPNPKRRKLTTTPARAIFKEGELVCYMCDPPKPFLSKGSPNHLDRHDGVKFTCGKCNKTMYSRSGASKHAKQNGHKMVTVRPRKTMAKRLELKQKTVEKPTYLDKITELRKRVKKTK
jgi:hypothetical protein